MELPFWFKAATTAALVLLILVDLALVARRPHVPSMREATGWVTFYVSLALGFSVLLLLVDGGAASGQFLAGWITEYSLSVDNLFVFVIIMSRFAVPRPYQQKVLMIGIIMSLILRGGFILIGAAAIQRFSWMFYLFGAFLVYTAVHLVREGTGGDDEFSENAFLRWTERRLKIAPNYDGAKLRTVVNGRRVATPMVVVLLAIGSTDLLFALDSIPAIFGLTQDPFIVFTATLFALMGLRQLYFLLGGLLDRLVFLSYGLAVILGFIGIKLILEALHTNELPFINGGHHVEGVPAIPIWLSLLVIVGVLGLTTALSLAASRRGERRLAAGAAAQLDAVPGGSAELGPDAGADAPGKTAIRSGEQPTRPGEGPLMRVGGPDIPGEAPVLPGAGPGIPGDAQVRAGAAVRPPGGLAR